MVKKLLSFLPVNEGRTLKKRDRKKGLYNRVLHYLISDNYMYAPLLSSKNPSLTYFTGAEENENSKNKPKKLVDRVIKYLLSDYHMYAPLVLDEPRLRAGVRRNSKNEPKKFLNKVKKYMLSDSYMYAPLLLDEPRLRSGVPEIEIGNIENQPKKLVDKVKKYMLSDCYMYAPLFLDEPRLLAGVQEKEYTENKSKSLVDRVKEYMVSDCYMYAPLLLDQPWLRAGWMSSSKTTVDTIRQGDATKSVTENARDARQNTKSTSTINQRVAEYPLTRKTIIKNTLLQRETVEHVIQKNGDPPSAKGNEKQEKWGKKRTKLNESSIEDTKRRRKVAAK